MKDESFLRIEPIIKRSNSMFLHPSPDIDIKVIKQIGDYSLGTELGSGAFGKVVLGKHILTNELVAIKILDKMILSHTPDDYQSVKQEINILKSVKHKHIVQLYEVLQTSRHIFIIMEYCEGKDLLDYILTKSKLSEEESLKYFQQLINALFYLHSQNIAHRDIKIDNMLLDRNRDLKLVDFGLSTKYPDDNLLDQPCGTVVYAAPEVLQGREYHGMLADVWSSGIVLYGMLSGYLPFGEQDDEVNRKNIIMGRINYPSYFSECVKDLLMHMLDLDPMTRYTLQEVRSHPWFNLLDYKLIPGIIIGYNIIPVDEKILNLCVTYNCDKEKVRESVVNNKYNSDSALYYLLIKKLQKKGLHSVSDFYSDEFINFVLDDNNLVESPSKDRNLNNKNQESEIKYNININANNNCSAPPDGKIRYKAENQEKNEINENNGNNNLITPQNSERENINKKINFDEEPKGALSFIINNSSFEETNRELFNIKHSNSNSNHNNININKFTNNDNDSKKTNKNTSSDSKNKNIVFQVVNVNDFQITDKISSENSEHKILIQNILENKINTNNIFIDENNKTEIENDYKLLNVFYKNTESNEKNDEEKEKEIEIENKQNNDNDNIIYKQDIVTPKANESNNLNISHNNNPVDIKNNDNSIEIIYDKSDIKNRNNDDILETPLVNGREIDINEDNISSKLHSLDKNIKNEFIIETPPNNKNNNKDSSNENKNISKNRNTLSKQKVYIDKNKNKTHSDKNNNEEKNKLDINKIKDIRKINLFQDEIKEEEDNKIKVFQIDMKEEDNYKKNVGEILLSEITDRELNDNLKKNTPRSKSKLELNDIKIMNNNNTPMDSNYKEIILDQISLNTDSNINKSFNKKDNNENVLLTDNIVMKNINNNMINNEDINSHSIDTQKINNNESINNKIISIDLDIKNINEDILNDKIQSISLSNKNEEIKTEENKNKIEIKEENKEKEENKNIQEIKEENINNQEIKEENRNSQEIKEEKQNMQEIKEENKSIKEEKEENKSIKETKEDNKGEIKNIQEIKEGNINIEPIQEDNENKQEIKEENKNIQPIKEENKKVEEKVNSSVQKATKKPKNNKLVKKKENKKVKIDNKKKRNPIINSIIKNYKAIIENNKSIEMKNKKSTSRDKNNKMNSNYSTKNKLSKNKDKEIISIKVIINKNLASKEKNKNNKSKNRTEQQEKKIKSIYRINNILPNNLSKTKYTTIKKPTVSIFKKKIMKNCYTNKKFVKNPKISGSHIKSSSIHIFGTMAKNDKCLRNNINNTTNNSNSLFKTNKFKNNKYVTSSRMLNKNKKVIKSNYLVKSYNNKYMKLFKSTQYKNNKLIFTNKIDKTNLNKKFDEIAHKINKSIKNNKNKVEEKKIPLWKYIQSDQHLKINNSNNKMVSSTPHLGKNDIKKGATNKNLNINKNPRDKIITQNSYENKTNDNIHLDKNIKLKDHNFNVNINKLNNINNKCNSLSKDKNINVFFINIKNYINNKNNNKKTNKKNIESSVTNQRYKSPYEIRELSESVKNKYLNQKTRFNKIPWKVKKKAIDEKLEVSELYKYYMNKNKNPFKKNNNKINKKQYNNIKPVNNKNNYKKIESPSLLYLNSINGIKYSFNKLKKPNNNNLINEKVNLKQSINTILTNKKKENIKTTNKKYTQLYTPQYLHQKSYFPFMNHNINQRNIVPNKLFHSTNNNSENKEKNNVIYKNYFYVFDLSCLYMKAENLNDCYQNLINKLIKKNIYFVQKPNKVIRCFKNGLCCEIEIVKMEQNNNNENKNGKNIYCFKILGKNGTYLNKMFKNILLE